MYQGGWRVDRLDLSRVLDHLDEAVETNARAPNRRDTEHRAHSHIPPQSNMGTITGTIGSPNTVAAFGKAEIGSPKYPSRFHGRALAIFSLEARRLSQGEYATR